MARESGGRVVPKQLLRDTNIPVVRPDDQRQLDLVVYGVTTNGVALCCDSTMVSPLTSRGEPIARAAAEDGVALQRAVERKRRTYGELVASPLGRLLVLGSEVGGRWSDDAQYLVAVLARHKAQSAPRMLQGAARVAWAARWWGLLGVAAQSALACTLCGEGVGAFGGPAGQEAVPLEDALDSCGARPIPSRLPMRG